MTRLCRLARPWAHPALLDYLPLELRAVRHGSQQEIRQGLIALGIGIGRTADEAPAMHHREVGQTGASPDEAAR